MPHLGMEKMPDYCCLVDCINSSSKRRGTRFFGFLLRDKKRCTRWTNAVRKLNWVKPNTARLYSDHLPVTQLDEMQFFYIIQELLTILI